MAKFDSDRLIRLEKTVRAVCRSPDVSWYKIGFTSNPSFKRAESHRKLWGYTSFIILADCLTREEALFLEKELCERMKRSPNDIIYKKYVAELRDKQHRSSYGGSPAERGKERIHSVYMIWSNIKDPEPGSKWPPNWQESWL